MAIFVYMARTRDEIFNTFITNLADDPVLSAALTSQSKASFYQSLFTLMTELIVGFEEEFDVFTSRMDALLDEKQVQTRGWWYALALAFQLGDAVIFDDAGQSSYAVIDEEKQIVKFSAISSENNSSVIVRAAGVNNQGLPTLIDGAELSAFTAYLEETKPVGFVVQIISEEGDEIKLSGNVVVNAQVINTDDGSLISDSSIKPVEVAIIEYISTFQRDSFGNIFRVNSLLNAILDVNGVNDFVISTFEKKSTVESVFTNVLALPGLKFNSFAGYIRIADAFVLGDNLTYSTE